MNIHQETACIIDKSPHQECIKPFYNEKEIKVSTQGVYEIMPCVRHLSLCYLNVFY